MSEKYQEFILHTELWLVNHISLWNCSKTRKKMQYFATTGRFFKWGWVGFLRYSQPYRQRRTRWAPPLWKERFCGLVGCRPHCRCRLPDGWCIEELAGNPELCSWVYTLSGNEGPGSLLPPDQRSRRCLWWKDQTGIHLWRSKQIQIPITTKTKAFYNSYTISHKIKTQYNY